MPPRSALNITPPAAPTPEESRPLQRLRRRAGRRDRAQGGPRRLASRGLSSTICAIYLKSEAEVAMVAHLAEALGDTQTAVRIGKTRDRAGLEPRLLRLSDPLAARLHAAAPAARARLHPRHRAPGERVQLVDAVGSGCARHPAGHAGDGQARVPRLQAQVRHPPPDEGPRLQHDAGQRLHLRSHGRVHRLLRADTGGLQRRPRTGARVDQGVRRSPRRQGRPHRLDPPHPLRGDARVRAEGALQHPGLPRAARREANAVRLNADLKRISAAPASP